MNSRTWVFASVATLAPLATPRAVLGAPDEDERVIRALPSARHSLLDAVRAATASDEVPISAKFEDEGKGLVLSVYTASGSLRADAEDAVLREHAGDPRNAEWRPAVAVFEDREHVARASEQLTLMRTTKLSLADVIGKAAALHGATVVSVTPRVRDGRAAFLVRVAAQAEIVAVDLDLATGVPIDGRWPRVLQAPEPTPLVGTVLPELTVGKGRWIGSTPPPLSTAVANRVVLVASNSYLCEMTDEAYSWPTISRWLEELGPRGLDVRFIVGEAESAGPVEALVAAKKLRFPVLHDPTGENAKAWDLGRSAAGLLLGADGKVVWQGRIGPQGDARGCEAAIRREIGARAAADTLKPR